MAQLSKARQLREDRFKLSQQAMAVLENTALSKEERRAKFDAMQKDVDDMKIDIDQAERAEANLETRGAGAPPNGRVDGGADDPTVKAEQEKRYEASYLNYLRHGWSPKPDKGIRGLAAQDLEILTPHKRTESFEARDLGPQFRDMSGGGQGAYPGATTGFFVPVGFVDKITEAMKYYGPMIQEGDLINTATGQPLPFPTDNDTTVAGELIGEGTQVSTGDVSIGQITFGAYKFSSKLIKVSIELLNDSAFDFSSYLTKKFATRLGRARNTYYTTGTGTNQPTGIITASTAGVTAVGSSGNDGGSGTAANSIGSDDLIAVEHSVDPLYRPGSKYMFHDATLKSLKQLKDKYGRPLWMPGLATKEPDSINGYAYAINNDMAQIATTNKTVAFGQLKLYTIRQVMDMSILRLEERFADYGQVGFLAFHRSDANLLDAGTHPVKYLTQG